MTAVQQSFHGWAGLDADSASGKLVWKKFEPKEFGDYDIDIEITHASIDGSDLHFLRGDWMPPDYPVVAGHEFVGRVIEAGSKVVDISIGDRVGVGGIVSSCMSCKSCEQNFEQHCQSAVRTYGGIDSTGAKTNGGFASHWRGDARYVTKIPHEIPSDEAAPLLCAGVTMYAALKHNGVGAGSRVGVVGIGGAGHLGLLFAKALGASKVVAISHTSTKKADAIDLGATDFVSVDGDPAWTSKFANSLDVIVNSVSGNSCPFSSYLGLLDEGGTLVQIGAPEGLMPGWPAAMLVLKRCKIVGSYLGSRQDVRNMLSLAAGKGIHPWVKNRPMRDINQAFQDFSSARYRFVLCNE